MVNNKDNLVYTNDGNSVKGVDPYRQAAEHIGLSQEQLNELENKHGRIAHIVGYQKAWEVVFRKPTRAEYKMFRAMATNDAKKADATEILCRATVVYPTKEQFDALLEDYVGICEASASALLQLCGLVVDDSLK